MTALRPLRGGCQCGRNRYIIVIPQDGLTHAQILFNTEPVHQVPLGSPLAAFIRVPLSWYHSTTHAFYPDETHSMIRRVYEHHSHEQSKRHFCGFCGTPLSFWSENPQTEAEYIHLTLGSLLREDITDLEDMGLMPELGDETPPLSEGSPPTATTPITEIPGGPDKAVALRHSFGVPWFDGLVEGTRLGNMRRSQGIKKSADRSVKIEWEIVEFDDDNNPDVEMSSESAAAPAKRKFDDSQA